MTPINDGIDLQISHKQVDISLILDREIVMEETRVMVTAMADNTHNFQLAKSVAGQITLPWIVTID